MSDTKYRLPSDNRLHQGEILSDLLHVAISVDTVNNFYSGLGELNVLADRHNLCIVLSQDCDLENDFNSNVKLYREDWKVPYILFCEIQVASQMRADQGIKSDIWKRIKQNTDERYQVLEAVPADFDQLNEGLEPMALDFKRIFTVDTSEIYEALSKNLVRHRTILETPYVEHLAHRFANYISRVALPRGHEIEPTGAN